MRSLNRCNRTLGILWAIYGVVLILKAVWILLYEPTLTVMWGALLNRVPDPFAWMNMFHFILYGRVVISFIAAIFSFLTAVALLQSSSSERRLGLVAGFFGLISGPLGIALGAFTVAILIPQGTGASMDSEARR
jgi:hypothetical protein